MEGICLATTHSAEETKALAACLAELLEGGEVIALDGDLGAGKTQFTQGIAQGLGIVEAVTSPTFTIMMEYLQGRLPLYHFDLYRLEHPEELEDIAFYEYVEGQGVSCIEWASKFRDELPEAYVEVYLKTLSAKDEGRLPEADKTPVSDHAQEALVRQIWVNASGEKMQRIVCAWQEAWDAERKRQ